MSKKILYVILPQLMSVFLLWFYIIEVDDLGFQVFAFTVISLLIISMLSILIAIHEELILLNR